MVKIEKFINEPLLIAYKMSTIGYLDNLCFDEDAKRLGNEIGLNSCYIREIMNKTIENLFARSNAPYIGPTTSSRYPMGGFFFKTSGKPEEALAKLGINESMKVRMDGTKYQFSIGFIAQDFEPDEQPDKIEWVDSKVLEFSGHVAAYYRISEENNKAGTIQPYFLIVDDSFKQKFPIDDNLDLT